MELKGTSLILVDFFKTVSVYVFVFFVSSSSYRLGEGEGALCVPTWQGLEKRRASARTGVLGQGGPVGGAGRGRGLWAGDEG